MSSTFWFLLILSFLASSKYTLGPILLRFKHSGAVNPTFNEVSEENARAWFPPNSFWTISELEALGFSLVNHLTSATITKRVYSMMSLLVNRSSQTFAMVTFARTLNPQALRAVNYIEFHSEFEDGSHLDTINSPSVALFYPVPNKRQVRVPHLKDPSALYLVHLHLMKQQSSAAVLPEPGNEKEYFIDSNKRSLAAQVETGYFFVDVKAQRYRPTWQGAFRSAYRLLWPMKQIIQRRQEREGKRIAAEAVQASVNDAL
jgi:hypothetical protein